jgi:hypothetical protein
MAKLKVVPIANRNAKGHVTWKGTSEELAPEVDALQKKVAILEARWKSMESVVRALGPQSGRLALPAADRGEEGAA